MTPGAPPASGGLCLDYAVMRAANPTAISTAPTLAAGAGPDWVILVP